ncbi:MAG TPA: thioredoxin family protein [Candidatus Angelobacter sp.]|nr:thioredoxin family protein [Candidatus Angelobacter sp.]
MLILLLAALLSSSFHACPPLDFSPQQAGSTTATTYAPPHNYDPARDPEKDLAAAGQEAKNSKRYIIAVVGGEWCSWCHILDDFFREHPDLAALRDKNYVLMKVNMSQENPNRDFLARYPRIHGYPHIFILDGDGKLVQSQPTNALEDGRSYNVKRFRKFLEEFAPKPGP